MTFGTYRIPAFRTRYCYASLFPTVVAIGIDVFQFLGKMIVRTQTFAYFLILREFSFGKWKLAKRTFWNFSITQSFLDAIKTLITNVVDIITNQHSRATDCAILFIANWTGLFLSNFFCDLFHQVSKQ